jgi:hypothetical protein
MISSLEDAWNWYRTVREQARYMQRLAGRFWGRQECDEALSLDNVFGTLRLVIFNSAQRPFCKISTTSACC